MRRLSIWLTVMLAAVTVICCGCGKAEPSAPSSELPAEMLRQAFDVSAVIQMGGVEAEADLNRTENGVCTFRFRKPETLSGLTVTLDRDTIGLSFLGLHVEADSEKVLNSSVTKAIVSSINRAAEPNGVAVEVEDGAICINGSADSGEFLLRLDPKEHVSRRQMQCAKRKATSLSAQRITVKCWR